MVSSSAVLRLNFCAKNPPLRQAAKRYFESNDHLVLTYELDRIKYWSIYDKQNQSIQTWFIARKEECGTCNEIRIIGIDGSNLFAVVSSQMLERLADAQLTDSLKITIKNYEYQDFVIKLEI